MSDQGRTMVDPTFVISAQKNRIDHLTNDLVMLEALCHQQQQQLVGMSEAMQTMADEIIGYKQQLEADDSPAPAPPILAAVADPEPEPEPGPPMEGVVTPEVEYPDPVPDVGGRDL